MAKDKSKEKAKEKEAVRIKNPDIDDIDKIKEKELDRVDISLKELTTSHYFKEQKEQRSEDKAKAVLESDPLKLYSAVVTWYKSSECRIMQALYRQEGGTYGGEREVDFTKKLLSLAYSYRQTCVILQSGLDLYVYSLDTPLLYSEVCTRDDFSGSYGGATVLATRGRLLSTDKREYIIKYLVTPDGAALKPNALENDYSKLLYFYFDSSCSILDPGRCGQCEVRPVEEAAHEEEAESESQLYNLVWDPQNRGEPAGREAYILYPAFMTPAVIEEDKELEFIVLVKGAENLTVDEVNGQLKIMKGPYSGKDISTSKLFNESEAAQKIKISQPLLEKLPENRKLGPIYIKTAEESISFIIDNRALWEFNLPKRLTAREYRQLKTTLEYYCTEPYTQEGINRLLRRCYKLDATDYYLLEEDLSGLVRLRLKKLLEKLNYRVEAKVYQVKVAYDCFLSSKIAKKYGESGMDCVENRDRDIRQLLKSINGADITGKGLYCFEVNERDVDINKVDLKNPIQAYHPVFVVKKGAVPFNIGHLTDIHISSRQLLLSKSNARVIDAETAGEDSVPLGSIINISSANFKEVLDKLGRDKNIDMLLITGDLVDHIKNVVVDRAMSAADIWRNMNLDNYQPYIDYVIFYTLIVYFYQKYQKPVFTVTGNHDSYLSPYGISPRLFGPQNEGIPADHNMTFYEAILIFGEDYDDIYGDDITETGLRSSMIADSFEWFFQVLTPLSSFSVQLPEQVVVGLGWGDGEDRLGDEQALGGVGHLPRSKEAISEEQEKVFEDGIIMSQKVTPFKKAILMSHFTIASYHESLSLRANRTGELKLEKEFGLFDFGTFEENREVFEQFKEYEIILTGHSHRRGLYKIEAVPNSDPAKISYLSNFYDFEQLNTLPPVAQKLLPNIVVSDSAGPLPRYNLEGEFYRWGSHMATGTKLLFDENGKLQALKIETVGRKPRFIVALDYEDILIKNYDKDDGDYYKFVRGDFDLTGFRDSLKESTPFDELIKMKFIEKNVTFMDADEDLFCEILNDLHDESDFRTLVNDAAFRDNLTLSAAASAVLKDVVDSYIFKPYRKLNFHLIQEIYPYALRRNSEVITDLTSALYSQAEEDSAAFKGYQLSIGLNHYFSELVSIKKLRLHFFDVNGEKKWYSIETEFVEPTIMNIRSADRRKSIPHYETYIYNWAINTPVGIDAFRRMKELIGKRGLFLTMGFAPRKKWLKDLYDFQSPWNFEVKLSEESVGNKKRYIISREREWAEIPDFEWREKIDKKYKAPYIAKGYWAEDADGNRKLTKAEFDDEVWLYFETENVSDGTEAEVTIYEYDPFVNDRVGLPVKKRVFDNKCSIKVKLDYTSFYRETGEEGESEFIFVVEIRVGTLRLKVKLPDKKDDMLHIDEPST